MNRDLYIRPIGLSAAPRASGEEHEIAGLQLAGGWLTFMGLEVIERIARDRRRTRVFGIGEYCERDWGRHGAAAAGLFEALRQPRARIAGVSLDRPRIMGIVNLTPDSFSDGGRLATAQAAIDHARRLEEEGADILDLGAESTRPGSDPVPADEELGRLMPVLEGLAGRSRALISVDTRKAEVMRRAAEAGADMLNDVSALTHDPESMEAAAESGLPIVLMHALGDPKTMQDDPRYDDVALDVFDYLEERVRRAEAAGIDRSRLIVDPGIGFGKTLRHNLALMAEVALLHGLGVPVLVGASRKRFIGTLSGVQIASERGAGSVGAALAAVGQGVQIVRVHDVGETRQALTVWEASVSGDEVAKS
ncbi:MAG: dihydropteroate synthase [Hyphomicrobiaceae bacterium]|nr:dihydropteroate synthase [Hyphomicrobiaceae bacterium]